MNYQVREYRGLTSSIKTWMSQCRSPSKSAILLNIISQSYKDPERQPRNVAPKITLTVEEPANQQPTFSVPELQPVYKTLGITPEWYLKTSSEQQKCVEPVLATDVDIGQLNTSPQSNVTGSDVSYKTAYEYAWVEDHEKCTPKTKMVKTRTYERYAEGIRYKIEFFETGNESVLKRDNDAGIFEPRGGSPRLWKVFRKLEKGNAKSAVELGYGCLQSSTIVRKDHAVSCLEEEKEPKPTTKDAVQENQRYQKSERENATQPRDVSIQIQKILGEGDEVTCLENEKQPERHVEVEVQQSQPVVTEMILKQSVVEQLVCIRQQAEVRDEITNLECSFGSVQGTSGASLFEERKKTVEDEKFVVNLYECRSSKKWPRVKTAVKGGYVRVNSQLFIKPAIGDGVTETTNTASSDDTGSSVETCKANNKCNKAKVDMDTSSVSNVSTLLDKSTATTNTSGSSISNVSALCESVSSGTELLDEVHNQCRIMQEATKAVGVCTTVKELAYGKEQLEAERILLLAGLKRALLLQQMREKRYGGASKGQFNNGGARLTISGMEIPLMLPEDHQDYKIWYVITCTCEFILQASQLIELKRFCHFLNFTGSFVFENVHPYSVVNLKVYQVKIRNNSNNRSMRKLCCVPQINTLTIRRSQKVQYRDLYSGMVVQSEVLPSIFTLCGSLDITMDLLLNKKNFLLSSTPNNSTLFGSLKLTAEVSNLSINQTHFGFLTLGREKNGSVEWERKWCHLQGTTMAFWDSPSEETFDSPDVVVDLKNCMGDKVEQADKHVLLLNVAGSDGGDNQNLVLLKYFLSADTSACLKKWKKRINSVLTSLRLWKALGGRFEG